MEEITLKKCIEFAVTTEETGAKFYNILAGKFADNEEVSALFKLFSKDEAVHRQQFMDLLEHMPQEANVSDAPEKREYLRAMSISEFFSHHHGPFKDADKIENRDDALEKSFGFEKATLGFYQAVQDVLGENPILTDVIEVEKSHITRLMKAMVTGEKFRGLQNEWS